MKFYCSKCNKTLDLNETTFDGRCGYCLEQAKLQAGYWFCPNCGEVGSKSVTYNETCDFCGNDVDWRED